ncbi:hypothetical protein [Paraburkholderia aspalathi]|uniref:Uncharacterized protein n=1 Tax=Paraburkholderia aspalathi TaxID=1324617 RepID=A0A1I7ERI5_9BURK|nr:hypothetical protein [Paraburkholderia aspalathi]SFU26524.1 hypothetical protein SAMN05192563_105735 [Paraburkholderia aspalathi]
MQSRRSGANVWHAKGGSITIIGIDLTKKILQVHETEEHDKTVLNKWLKRQLNAEDEVPTLNVSSYSTLGASPCFFVQCYHHLNRTRPAGVISNKKLPVDNRRFNLTVTGQWNPRRESARDRLRRPR